MTDFGPTALRTIHHYLLQIEKLIDVVEASPDGDRLWYTKLAPDMLDTGFNLAVATGFAGRALCLPAGIAVPDIPTHFTCESLKAHHQQIRALISPISLDDLATPVRHRAGDAEVEQEVGDYILRFALPNMIFHMSIAYAGLRHAGLEIGKADFDGLHIYIRLLK